MLFTLAEVHGVTICGIQGTQRLEDRTPTRAFILKDKSPRQVADELVEAKVYVPDGNYYALEVTERMGMKASNGMVRVGLVHYNTVEEIRRFG